MSDTGKTGGRRSVVIRREEVVEGGHHGGAWKVAYADFVTAMMAFFLLMWLLNATTEAQRKGLADYFTPSNAISQASSGTGQPFGGRTPYDQGALTSDRGVESVHPGKVPPAPDGDPPDIDDVPDPNQPMARTQADGSPDQDADGSGRARTEQAQDGSQAPGGGLAAQQAKTPSVAPSAAQAAGAARAQREQAAFDQAAGQIRDAVRADPALAGLLSQLAIDQTPEGLRIQLLDEERLPMFATGSSVMNERGRRLLQKIAPVLAALSEPIAITGHTDAAPYKGDGKTNWELSTERANATRRLLSDAGLVEGRVRSVTGNADRDPLLPADPLAAANRRIAIVVLRTAKIPG